MDLRRPSRRLGRPPPAFGRSPAELDTSCVRRLVPPRNFRVATNRHARVAAGANDSSRNVEHRGWKQELGASGTSVRAGYRSRSGEHEAVTIDGGFEWYGSLDPGTLSRFPTEVLETERIGPWTDPQLLLMEIQGRRVLVANVRMMLPSVVIQLVAHSTNDRSQTIRPASRSTRTSPPLDVDRRARPRRRDSPRRRLQYSSAYAVSPPLRDFLSDAWLRSGSGWGATVPEFFPLARIDQIWISRGIQPVSVRVVRVEGSDHRAVIADLSVGQDP